MASGEKQHQRLSPVAALRQRKVVFDALRQLDAWKRSCRLSANVVKLLGDCPNRPFRDQLTRSGLSVASNIGEGYSREAGKDRVRFLVIAKGSCKLVKSPTG